MQPDVHRDGVAVDKGRSGVRSLAKFAGCRSRFVPKRRLTP